MDHNRQSLRIGAAAILCALLLRFSGGGLLQRVGAALAEPTIASWLIYLETGRNVRFSPSLEDKEVFSMESATPDFAARPQNLTELPHFTGADGTAVDIKYNCTYRPDVEKLITQPLSWDLTKSEPTVLILHTHATESYTKSPGEQYKETSDYRTLDENYNMISLGAYLAELLEAGGVGVVHDRTLHDYPSYNGSYNHARKSIAAYLEEYPSIQLVLDLHRDASGDGRNQMKTRAEVDGQKSAQIMLVVGTSGSGLKHPNWEQNLALGLKLHSQLERTAPGITRYVNLRAQRFNQDMSPGCLIVEIGAAGNTHAEAMVATQVLAESILALAEGSSVS